MGIFQSLILSESDNGSIKERIRKKLLSFHKLIYNVVKGFFHKVQFILSNKSPTKASNDQPTNQDITRCNDRENAVYSVARPRHVVITIPELEYSLDCTSVSDQDEYFVEEFTAVDIEEEEEEDDDDGSDEVIKNVMLEISRTTDTHDLDVTTSAERCIKHYSNRHVILLVGEGDFSFSSCLAVAFGFAPNMIATSLDSEDFLKKHYQNAMSNIDELRSRHSIVMHGIDATQMADHALLKHLSFDRIIYNFPFAGFFKDMSRESQLRRHRTLISLFLKNAKEMISDNGEIHITHKTNAFHREWNIVSIASSHGLRMIEAVKFNLYDYPRYRTKCGFGGDNNFNCNPSKTYKLGLV